MKNRIYFLDNLRTFMIFFVVLLHSGLVYEAVLENTWIVVDPNKANSIGLIRMYLDLFVMFIIFFISGYFIPYSTRSKSSWEFIKSKIKRIIIPWIIAVLTLIPAYKVIFLYSRGMPQEAWQTYFHFFARAGGDMSSFADNPVQNWLWFLPLLFVFQLIYLAMTKMKISPVKVSLKTAVMLLFVFGLIYSMVISEVGLKGWHHSVLFHFQRERLMIYFMAFLLGALCHQLKVFDSNKKNMKYYIISNVVLTIALGIFTVVALNLFFNIIEPGRNYYFVSEFADRIAYYMTALLSMLSFLYVFIHLFRFNFNQINTLMTQLNRSSYSVYIIHIVVMGFIALAMINLHINGFIKFIVLTLSTYILSNSIVIVYQGWIKQNLPLRVGTFTVLVVALFAFIQFGNKVSEPLDKTQSQSFMAPSIGLQEAVITGNAEAIRQHIKAGTNLDEKDPTGGSTPLITSAVFGKTEIALLLMEAGADLNAQNNEGSTPLITAAFFCRPEIVEALLAKGADKTIQNKQGSTALDSVTGSFESVKPIYDYFNTALNQLGLVLDYDYLQTTRPVIAKMLN